MKDRILYLGSSWHANRTGSTVFLVDFLREVYEVDLALDKDLGNADNGYWGSIDTGYKAVIFFQDLPPKESLRRIKNRNIVFFPMYDTCSDDYNWWVDHQNIKIVNFCRKAHKLLEDWGLNSIYTQYFPEPQRFSPGEAKDLLFWQRREQINIGTLKSLFPRGDVKIHIHKAMDPNHVFLQPTPEDESRYSISYSEWFEDRTQLKELIERNGIYVAPRMAEGIGMSFLDAMAMGKAVVAVDRPTMNEYIVDNVTGYLYDLMIPVPVDLGNIKEVQKNTHEYMSKGYARWKVDKNRIIDFIEAEPKEPGLRHRLDWDGFTKKILRRAGIGSP